MELRVHYSDDDNGGVKKKGFGFSVGPANFDIKTERWTDLLDVVADPAALGWRLGRSIFRDKAAAK